jgi:hypothetical protein
VQIGQHDVTFRTGGRPQQPAPKVMSQTVSHAAHGRSRADSSSVFLILTDSPTQTLNDISGVCDAISVAAHGNLGIRQVRQRARI